MTLLLHPWHLPGRVPASLTLTEQQGKQFTFSLPLQQQRNLARLWLPDSSPQTTHKPHRTGTALLQLHCSIAILPSRASFSTPRLVIYSFLGLGRGNTWDEAQLFHNFCRPFFQQVNKSKCLIMFIPLLPESIKIIHKKYLGNSNAHQNWNKLEYFLCCDGWWEPTISSQQCCSLLAFYPNNSKFPASHRAEFPFPRLDRGTQSPAVFPKVTWLWPHPQPLLISAGAELGQHCELLW